MSKKSAKTSEDRQVLWIALTTAEKHRIRLAAAVKSTTMSELALTAALKESERILSRSGINA